jgi:hypothetical protein
VDDELCRRFFRQPQATFHRRYEAFRAYFLDGLPLAAVADRFGYRRSSLKSLLCRFRAACANGGPTPFFYRTGADAPSVSAGVKMQTVPNHPRSPTSDS